MHEMSLAEGVLRDRRGHRARQRRAAGRGGAAGDRHAVAGRASRRCASASTSSPAAAVADGARLEIIDTDGGGLVHALRRNGADRQRRRRLPALRQPPAAGDRAASDMRVHGHRDRMNGRSRHGAGSPEGERPCARPAAAAPASPVDGVAGHAHAHTHADGTTHAHAHSSGDHVHAHRRRHEHSTACRRHGARHAHDHAARARRTAARRDAHPCRRHAARACARATTDGDGIARAARCTTAAARSAPLTRRA